MGQCQSSSSDVVSTSKNFASNGCEALPVESTFNASSQAFSAFENLDGSAKDSVPFSTTAERNSTIGQTLLLSVSKTLKSAPKLHERRATSPPDELSRSVDFDPTERVYSTSEHFDKRSSWSCLCTSDSSRSEIEDYTTSCHSRLTTQNIMQS